MMFLKKMSTVGSHNSFIRMITTYNIDQQSILEKTKAKFYRYKILIKMHEKQMNEFDPKNDSKSILSSKIRRNLRIDIIFNVFKIMGLF